MTPDRPHPLPDIPELDDEFEFVRELGRGGTAVVYLARDRELRRDVAIKLIRPSYLQDEDAIARLEREARTVGKLQHPNIVLLLGTRRLGKKGLALILQFVPGRTLKERIRELGPLPIREVVQVLRDVGRALAYAHRRRIVHRDIKPENVYLDDDAGVARLADFGIARPWDSDSGLTLPGTAIGTPTYMSPEQVDGADLDGRSDIYSLGLLGYEMLTGRQPWEDESLYNVIYKQKHEALPPLKEARPDTPRGILQLLDRALRKDPEERWPDAEAFLKALDAASETEAPGTPATPDFFGWHAPGSAASPTSPSPASPSPASPSPTSPVPSAPESEPATPGEDGADEPIDLSSLLLRYSGEREMEPDGPDPVAWPRGAGWATALVVLLLGVGAGALALTSAADGRVGGLFDRVGSGADQPPATPGEAELERPGGFDTWAADPATDIAELDSDLPLPGTAEDADGPEQASAGLPGGSLALIQGDGQTGPPGTLLPQTIVFQVEDADGSPVAGVAVELEVTSGGGTVQPARPVSDAAGFVGFRWVLGSEEGPQSVDARLEGAPGDPVTLAAEAISMIPAELDVVAGSGQQAEPGAALGSSVRVRVLNAEGRGVPGTTVLFQVAEGEGSVSSGSAATDASGEAATRWVLGPRSGGQRLLVVVPDAGLQTTVEAEAVPARLAPRPTLLAGGTFSCSLSGGGVLRCWGSNAQGQLGDGSGARRLAPGPSVGTFARLAVGVSHACALDPDGMPHCWGSNSAGQLGDGSTTTRTEPTPVPGVPPLVEIAAGAAHTCGVARTGGIHCWGDNGSGQLGDGTQERRTSPVQAGQGSAFRTVTAGWQHTCGLTTGGAALCWGDNGAGQLGRSGASSSSPGPVTGSGTFTQISAGGQHTCGRVGDGTVLCWGSNQYGQLGDATTQSRSGPSPIDSELAFQAVTAGAQHSCAIAETGGAYCWGRNLYGQLGDSTTDDRSSPVPVEGSLRFSEIHALGSHTCGRSPAGELICWGYNSDGQLGDGSRTNRPTPIQVGSPGS